MAKNKNGQRSGAAGTWDEAEVEYTAKKTGDVLGLKSEAKPAADKPGTVCLCLNYPRDVRFDVPDARGVMRKIVVKGNAGHLKGAPKGVLPVGAYGLTMGVDAEAWAWIQKNHSDNPLIKKGLLFSSTAAQSEAAAVERAELRNGLEPIKAKETA